MVLTLLGVNAKKLNKKTNNSSLQKYSPVPCPDHEPLCEQRGWDKSSIVRNNQGTYAQISTQYSPVPCPDHEPLCEQRGWDKSSIVRNN